MVNSKITKQSLVSTVRYGNMDQFIIFLSVFISVQARPIGTDTNMPSWVCCLRICFVIKFKCAYNYIYLSLGDNK